MKIQDIASILAKLSNSDKCDLGFLIQKKKTHRGYAYNLVPESFDLEPEELYDLTRKTGKNRFTLEQALQEHPGLKKHIKDYRLKTHSGRPLSQTKRPAIAALAKRTNMPKTTSNSELSDQAMKSLFARFLQEVADQGGLSISLNLNIRFTGFESE